MRYFIAILVSLAILTIPANGQDTALGDPLAQSLLKDRAAREAAIKGLSLFEDAQTTATILGNYSAFDATSRLAAVSAMSVRTSNAMALMAAVKQGKVPRADLMADAIGQLRSLGDPQIGAWVDETWAVARRTPYAKTLDIKKYKKMLDTRALKPDLSKGRVLFVKTCQQCHTLYGVGGKVGPDITATSRADLDYLLVSIVDPSAVILKEFQVTNLWTKDDQILSGIVSKEDESALMLQTDITCAKIAKENIETAKKSEISMMGEGILAPLSQQDVINLIGYLRGSEQVALPPGAASQPTVQKIAAAQPATRKSTDGTSPDAVQVLEPQTPL